jgi:hypothetical protein
MIDHAKQAIEAAFPAVPLKDSLRDLRMFMNELHRDAPSLDSAADWHELADILVEGGAADAAIYLAYLQGATWRHVVPAWMTTSLRLAEDQQLAEEFAMPVVGTLDAETSKGVGDDDAVYANRVTGLTTNQRTAIGEFVGWAVTLPMMQDKRSASLVQRLITSWPEPRR